MNVGVCRENLSLIQSFCYSVRKAVRLLIGPILTISFFIMSSSAQTRSNEWTWKNGTGDQYEYANYGDKGVSGPENLPGKRSGSVSWTDNTGNLWLFGGGKAYNSFNDLWKFDLTTDQWTWVKGSDIRAQNGVYGVQGIPAPENTPSSRYNSVSWTDTDGNLWLFGGFRDDATESTGSLNDLWKYDLATNEWTWVKGSASPNESGVYGIKGTPATGNKPGARSGSVSWVDEAGNFWLFGGNTGEWYEWYNGLNDLWKYDPTTNQWTWVNGSDSPAQNGIYGIQGTPAPENTPGSRHNSLSWTDNDGNLWLFGGEGIVSWTSGWLNDLWKYNPATNQWTWVKGGNLIDANGVYGVRGIPSPENTPGGRSSSVSWVDDIGNLWLFGGLGIGTTFGNLNDLWQYDPTINQWTWIKGGNTANQIGSYGTQETPTLGNTPGSRYNSVPWIDNEGKFWMFGGENNSISGGWFSDLWKYDPVTNQWTWNKGSNSPIPNGIYGTHLTPGSTDYAISWSDDEGNRWLFGGYGYDASGALGQLNDMWKYVSATNQWTWVKGSKIANQNGIYGTQGTSALVNSPGSRIRSVSWEDNVGNLWLFGGYGYGASGLSGSLNDLWKYTPTTNQWTWVKGSNSTNQNGVYGAQGTPALGNSPGSRYNSVSWTDSNGYLWLFGGEGIDESGQTRRFNDLWVFNPATNQWTWVKGSNVSNQNGVYGAQGTPAPGNTPGSRYSSASWTDNNGSLWLFGGEGYISGTSGWLNDLWKYDPTTNQWTWVKGSNSTDQSGVYGTAGTSALGNNPGGRQSAVSWTDNVGNLWLFGGYGCGVSELFGTLNDLWKYTPATNQWTWIKGSSSVNQNGVYGMLGESAPENSPGGRQSSVSWTDHAGDLWLFGGSGYAALGSPGLLNDLWKYDSETSQWMWVKGSNFVNQEGSYVAEGVSAPGNTPGSRIFSISWTDNAGDFWLFGGLGYGVSGVSGFLNDLWKYDRSTDHWTWVNGSNSTNQNAVYGVRGTPAAGNTPGARGYSVSWTDSVGNLWLFGGSGRNVSGNDLWKYDLSTNQWTWVKGSNSPNQKGTYGAQGTSAPGNTPGSRTWSVSWTDNFGSLWLFGGYGRDASGAFGPLNDLWKYDLSTNQWTWVKGSNLANQGGTYGAQGMPAPGNTPGARRSPVSWVDGGGNLWLFGGYGNGIFGSSGALNDLWKYDLSTNQWTWVKGSNSANQNGYYGTQGTPAPGNTPGSRGWSMSWTDSIGNLWLFGGDGFASERIGNLNDMWKYDPATNHWSWLKGSDSPNKNGSYGTQGSPASGNTPGARYGSVSWTDDVGNFWLFGSGTLNDVWMFDPHISSNVEWNQALQY